MAEIPGLDAEVYFGDTEQPLPNWREVLPDEDDDSDELSAEDRAAIVGMLGFDPSDNLQSDGSKESPAPTSAQPTLKPSKLISTKGLLDGAARMVADRWNALEQRYGRKVALGMLAAMVATLPLPGNIAAIIAAAEAGRYFTGQAPTAGELGKSLSKSLTTKLQAKFDELANQIDEDEAGGIQIWCNDSQAIIDTMDWGNDVVAKEVGALAEQLVGKENVTYQNEGAKPKGEGWQHLSTKSYHSISYELVQEFRQMLGRLWQYGIRTPSLSDDQIARVLYAALGTGYHLEGK